LELILKVSNTVDQWLILMAHICMGDMKRYWLQLLLMQIIGYSHCLLQLLMKKIVLNGDGFCFAYRNTLPVIEQVYV
jgi:hypothetical protein